jgi:hypothetical protein
MKTKCIMSSSVDDTFKFTFICTLEYLRTPQWHAKLSQQQDLFVLSRAFQTAYGTSTCPVVTTHIEIKRKNIEKEVTIRKI